MKKTIKIADLIKQVNNILSKSTCTREERLALCTFIENIMFQNSCYAGYSHLGVNDVPAGEKPGILRNEFGNLIQDENGHNIFPDDSRRCYAIKTGL